MAMVNLTRIYTRTGDDGTTGSAAAAGSQDRRPAGRLRRLRRGQLRRSASPSPSAGWTTTCAAVLIRVQNDLFDVGADLCTPGRARPEVPAAARHAGADRAARARDATTSTPSSSQAAAFVLPGGTPAAAQLHVARTVVRRAERATWAALEEHAETMNPLTAKYLNRLSDLLFILARYANRERGDVLWVPGREPLTRRRQVHRRQARTAAARPPARPGSRSARRRSSRTPGSSRRRCARDTRTITAPGQQREDLRPRGPAVDDLEVPACQHRARSGGVAEDAVPLERVAGVAADPERPALADRPGRSRRLQSNVPPRRVMTRRRAREHGRAATRATTTQRCEAVEARTTLTCHRPSATRRDEYRARRLSVRRPAGGAQPRLRRAARGLLGVLVVELLARSSEACGARDVDLARRARPSRPGCAPSLSWTSRNPPCTAASVELVALADVDDATRRRAPSRWSQWPGRMPISPSTVRATHERRLAGPHLACSTETTSTSSFASATRHLLLELVPPCARRPRCHRT